MNRKATRLSQCALLALTFACVVLISGCGGGGSSDGTMPQPQGPPGTVDTSFGSAGKLITNIGDHIALLPLPQEPAVFRYESNGTPDVGFGLGGVAPSIGSFSAYHVALQSDGKIVAAGAVTAGLMGSQACALVRYLSDGTADPSFGDGGSAQCNFGAIDNRSFDVKVQPDARIVVAVFNGQIQSPDRIVRFDAKGAPDDSFGASGVVPAIGGMIAIQSDGKIVVARWEFTGCTLWRLDAAGAHDPTFGQGGQVVWDLPLAGGPGLRDSVATRRRDHRREKRRRGALPS